MEAQRPNCRLQLRSPSESFLLGSTRVPTCICCFASRAMQHCVKTCISARSREASSGGRGRRRRFPVIQWRHGGAQPPRHTPAHALQPAGCSGAVAACLQRLRLQNFHAPSDCCIQHLVATYSDVLYPSPRPCACVLRHIWIRRQEGALHRLRAFFVR